MKMTSYHTIIFSQLVFCLKFEYKVNRVKQLFPVSCQFMKVFYMSNFVKLPV